MLLSRRLKRVAQEEEERVEREREREREASLGVPSRCRGSVKGSSGGEVVRDGCHQDKHSLDPLLLLLTLLRDSLIHLLS